MNVSAEPDIDDPFVLSRFVTAQEAVYADALAEIRAGRKQTHWMWFIFPQVAGLGSSDTSKFFAISGIEEARAYISHPILGPRLRECADAALHVANRSAFEIFGSPDDQKLQSSATLFAAALGPGSEFDRLLERFFGGRRDTQTLRLLSR